MDSPKKKMFGCQQKNLTPRKNKTKIKRDPFDPF